METTTNIIRLLVATLSLRSRLRARVLPVSAAMLLLLLSARSSTFAGSATWQTSPSSGDWNTATNWMPTTVPNGIGDTATFATSNRTAISLSASTEVNGITFNAGASAFTITVFTVDLKIFGEGIINNSGIAQNFVVRDGIIFFENTSSAGNGIFAAHGGDIAFDGTATAGNGTFINLGVGATHFFGASTAGNATITNATSNGFGGETKFEQTATAGSATVIANGDGSTVFIDTATAGSATLIANSGSHQRASEQNPPARILFLLNSDGGTARVEVFGFGNLDISGSLADSMKLGSIEGDGDVFLGRRNLHVGSNNLSTNFWGVIQDGGFSHRGRGSLTKIGTGKLVLSHANTYSGGTTIKRGKLLINNKSGSGTGSGAVQVDAGTLGGRGTINGNVTVGTGSGAGAVLAPGFESARNPGTLTIQSTLTFNSDATYECLLNSSTATADKVVADGITINGAAQFSFADAGTGTLTSGAVFTVISNTAATPIAGTFGNLADGSTFTSNGNTYRVNYEGGDDNDLTLMVVP